MTNTRVMFRTWKPSPGTVVKSVIDQNETATDSAMVTSGTSASSGDR